jgi:di/tricarboxylate transporter
VLILWITGKAVYQHYFRREQRRAEFEAGKEQLRQGRVRRMSLVGRCVVQLVILGIVALGWLGHEKDGSWLGLSVFVPLFVLFAAAELNVTLQPGDFLFPDPRDELMGFFKTQMLRAGYLTALAAMLVVFVVSLFAQKFATVLLPVALSVSLLVPGFVYSRLDRAVQEGE